MSETALYSLLGSLRTTGVTFIGLKFVMRYLGIILVLCSFPMFLSVLRSGPTAQRWAIMALGALPVIGVALNVDAAFVNWATWPGHTKGIIVSLTDTLALAICVKFCSRQKNPLLLWIWVFYILSNLPGLFLGSLFSPALFFLVSLIKAAIYFLACYYVFCRGGLSLFVSGLCAAVLANSSTTIMHFLQGQAQPAGLVGHRNHAGMINNLAIPILLVVGSLPRIKVLPLLTVCLAGIAAVLSSSRAVLILFGFTVYLTLIFALFVKPSKQFKIILTVCVFVSFVAIPISIHKISQRSEDGEIVLSKDPERLAFERAAHMMNKDYPWGIGLNQYAVLANTGGYSAAAGVAWTTSAKSATVHNSFVLVRTEGGPIALVGMLALFLTTIAISASVMWRRRNNSARIFAVPALVATLVLSIHLSFEWVFVSITTLYGFASITALAAYAIEASRRKVAQQKRSLAPSPLDQALAQPQTLGR